MLNVLKSACETSQKKKRGILNSHLIFFLNYPLKIPLDIIGSQII